MRKWARIIVGVTFFSYWGHAGLVRAAQIPVFEPIPTQYLTVGELFTYEVEASGDPTPTYSLTLSPGGMAIDSVTGVITWTPVPDQAGSRGVRVRASNTAGYAELNFNVTVFTVAPVPVVFDPIPDQTVRANTTWTYTLSASGSPAPTFTYTTVPFGMELDHQTHVLSWKPAPWQAGTHTVIVSAGNIMTSVTQTFTVTVLPALFTVQLSSGAGGSVTRPGEGSFEYEYNQRVEVEASPDAGHLFTEWTGSAVDAGLVTFTTRLSIDFFVTQNCTLVANFKPTTGQSLTLTVSSGAGGHVTQPGEGSYSYVQGTSVILLAAHDADWEFLEWTGSAVDCGKVADPTDAYTTVTMDGNYTVQANFVRSGAVTQYTLTITATAGGDTYPNQGMHKYYEGAEATIRADAMEGYRFSRWTGTAVDAGKVGDPSYPNTRVIMDADYTVTANFEVAGPAVLHTLTLSSGDGGSVLSPGEGAFQYDEGETVSVTALADDGYRFSSWSGTAVDAGKVANPAGRNTTVTMDGDYTLTANFEASADPVTEYVLTVTSTDGGQVSAPGEGSFPCDDGEQVNVVAQANSGYQFAGWTGTAVNAGRVANPTAANTSVTMDGDYSLCANFTAVGQGSASVELLAPTGGESLVPGSIVSITWQIQGAIALVNIELSVDGGATWTQIAQRSGAVGSCSWEVPPVDSSRCLIRISAAGDAGTCDTSNAPFSIRPAASRIWYVDAAAAGAGNGTSWVDAFPCLQDALARAIGGDSVLVAEGLYWPDLGGGRKAGDRTASFQLKTGVAIYGGFPVGGGEWSRRNPAVHRSILSGDIGAAGVAADNSYHVVTADGVAKSAVLDGCTICDGHANGIDPYNRGAGLHNVWGSPQIRNCTLVRNSAAGDGGGVCNINGYATFVNCIVTGNTAAGCGGGWYNEQGTATLINCTLTANQGLWRGGGVFSSAGAVMIGNSILWGNGRQYRGAYDEWAQASGDSQPQFTCCCVQGWTGSLGGEGNFAGDPQFVDADGQDGVAGTPDDDLRLSQGSLCIDTGSIALLPSGITMDLEGKPRVQNAAVDLGAYEFSPGNN